MSFGTFFQWKSDLWNSPDPLVHCLVKRCDQESVRAVEDRIIQTSQISEMVWRTDDSLTPVVVFCEVASRIEADIESAMRGVHGKLRALHTAMHTVSRSVHAFMHCKICCFIQACNLYLITQS
ncbi:hypothetical protein AC249_AIPGENE13516 [Exaiptasia diaphana]|nr:hypothetical protein AC249_AIPGENE13516 [Exaiptasia diaphana]